MLRFAVLALLLANVGYYLWSQGMLAEWGFAPAQEGESHRIEQQIKPEQLQITRPKNSKTSADAGSPGSTQATTVASPVQAASGTNTVASAPSTPSTGGECLMAGVFDERQAETLRSVAASMPAGSWVLEPTPQPGRWMIYMGRFADQEALEKKQAELRARKVNFDRANNPALEPGLSLGRFASEETAQRELANLATQGVRTARVVQERAESPGFTLRLPAVTDAMKPQLGTLRTALGSKTLKTCS
jgi:hypothetical protein